MRFLWVLSLSDKLLRIDKRKNGTSADDDASGGTDS